MDVLFALYVCHPVTIAIMMGSLSSLVKTLFILHQFHRQLMELINAFLKVRMLGYMYMHVVLRGGHYENTPMQYTALIISRL